MSASDRDALMRKAKEAGMPRFNPAMAPQMGVMAMRMGAGGVAEGVAPAMQTATTTGENDTFSSVALFCHHCSDYKYDHDFTIVILVVNHFLLFMLCCWYCEILMLWLGAM